MKNIINEARRPANKQIGQHLFKGLRYDSNGNPLYTCDTLSNEDAQAMGWKFSPKYGLYGQLSDPTMFYESKKQTVRLTESQLKKVISESVKKVLNESDYKVRFALQTINHYYDYAMECFNDPHRGFPKQAVANVIKAAKTLLPYKDQDNDIKNAIIKAKQLSNLAKREVEINRRGQEICDNEGGLAYMDYLDSVGKIPTIEESVKQVISELDYKTLANAEKEASRRGQRSYWSDKGYDYPSAVSKAASERIRAEKFGKAARDAFNRDHGYKTGDYWDNEGYAEVGLGGDFRSTEEFAPHAVGYRSKGYGSPAKYERGMRQDSYERMEPEEFFETNPEAAEAYRNADAEWKNYKKGNYDYTKGKGWNLKDK